MKLIIDTDGGADDAMALFYLLKAETFAQLQNNSNALKILAITCVNGNTHVDNVIINVLKVLKIANRLDIPVFQGANKSLITTPPPDNFFGQDGLGDVHMEDPPSPDLKQKEHAVQALIKLVNENPGEITILTLGPLTNIAMAIRMSENFIDKLKKIVVMGGCVEGRGNMVPGVEYNFFIDPEASYIVLNGTDYDDNFILLSPWESALQLDIKKKWRKEVLGALSSKEIQFMNQVEHIEDYKDDDVWTFTDVFAAMVLLNKTLIQKKESYGIEVILQGPTRGGLTIDYHHLKSNKKIEIIYTMNAEAVKNTLIEHFS